MIQHGLRRTGTGAKTMHIKNVTFHPQKYPTKEFYPFNLPIFHQTKKLLLDTPVSIFIGENATGKSTLLETIAHRCGITIRQVQYKETELYRIYRGFMEDRHKYMNNL